MNVHVKGLAPGLHGIHIHAVGACSPTFAAAGGHYNPLGHQHGLDNPNGSHAGDLPNLVVNGAGVGHLDATTDRVTLSPGPATLFDATGERLHHPRQPGRPGDRRDQRRQRRPDRLRGDRTRLKGATGGGTQVPVVARSLTASPFGSNRLLGLAGIVGGAVLLVAFVVDIAPELNSLRLILYNVGAVAIIAAVHLLQSPIAPRLALLGAVPALVANVGHLVMIVLATGRPEPIGAGAFGLVYFWVATAMWLTDAWFGVVTVRLGVVSRVGALALAIGSVLAFTGLDRLGLVSSASPTIFNTLALAGIAVHGIGWILLGIDVATRRQALASPRHDGAPDGWP